MTNEYYVCARPRVGSVLDLLWTPASGELAVSREPAVSYTWRREEERHPYRMSTD